MTVANCTNCLYLKTYNLKVRAPVQQVNSQGRVALVPTKVCARNAPSTSGNQDSAGWQIIDDPDNMTCGEGADATSLTSYSSGVIGLPRTGANNAGGGGTLTVNNLSASPPQQIITLPHLSSGFYYVTELRIRLIWMFANDAGGGGIIVPLSFADLTVSTAVLPSSFLLANAAGLVVTNPFDIIHFTNPQIRLDATHDYGLLVPTFNSLGIAYGFNIEIAHAAYTSST